MTTVVSWNVNSLKARLELVLRYIDEMGPDVLCLQETRVADAAFPRAAFEARGYHVAAASTGGYAGVAIATRSPVDETVLGLSSFVEQKAPGRRIAVRIGHRWIDTVYVPTRVKIGKAAFLDTLRADQDARFGADAEVILAGDFNICFDKRDCASPKMISDPDIHPNRPEDQAFRRLLDGRLVDCFRVLQGGAGYYSWFPVTPWALKRNYGMRLDYVFASEKLASRVVEATHDKAPHAWPRPSDHLPVRVRFET